MKGIAGIIICLSLLTWSSQAQDDARNVGHAVAFHISYAFQMPVADLSERYGSNNNVGLGLEFITDKSNLILGLNTGYLFGDQVKTDVLAGLRTAEGFIVGNDKGIADIVLKQRGFYAGALVGKIWPLGVKEPRSGLRTTLGAGLLQHKIRIQDDPQRAVAALSAEYKKGYDRLSNGLAFQGFIGYQILSKDKRINFYVGAEACYGTVQNRRSFNFDTRSQDTRRYRDGLIGLRAGWVLPIYTGKAAREIFY